MHITIYGNHKLWPFWARTAYNTLLLSSTEFKYSLLFTFPSSSLKYSVHNLTTCRLNSFSFAPRIFLLQ